MPVLELFSMTVDAGDGHGVAQVVEPSFSLLISAPRRSVASATGTRSLVQFAAQVPAPQARRLQRRALPVVPLVLVL